MSEMTKMKSTPARLTCTYAEAIYLVHQKGYAADIEAAVGIISYIFGRKPEDVREHIKKGLP